MLVGDGLHVLVPALDDSQRVQVDLVEQGRLLVLVNGLRAVVGIIIQRLFQVDVEDVCVAGDYLQSRAPRLAL